MLIQAGYDLGFYVNTPTPMVAMLNLHPSRTADLRTPHALTTDRGIPLLDYRDSFGNVCTRMTLPVGTTTLSCNFLIEDHGQPDPQVHDAVQHEIDQLPADVLLYLVSSRYCDTERLSNDAWALFGHTAPGWSRVEAIVDFTHERLAYGYQFARATRTAAEGFNERVGVCRDFAHLAVALCRSMNIPARYCSGYLGDIGIPPVDVAMDFHAWFEVYLGGAWHAFDARHRVPRIGRILMAVGRDAADTALTTAFGPASLTAFTVRTDEVVMPERFVQRLAA
jgi:transglutaminase-like putative cysteine protease